MFFTLSSVSLMNHDTVAVGIGYGDHPADRRFHRSEYKLHARGSQLIDVSLEIIDLEGRSGAVWGRRPILSATTNKCQAPRPNVILDPHFLCTRLTETREISSSRERPRKSLGARHIGDRITGECDFLDLHMIPYGWLIASNALF
jgi:hypothetical protein